MIRNGYRHMAAWGTAAALLLSSLGCAWAEGQTPMTLSELTAAHGAMTSTTEEAVTDAQLDALYDAAAAVTLGSKKTWHLTVIPDLDLIQELLPTYNEAGLIHEGNVAIIVSCTSDSGAAEQYSRADMSRFIAAGMIAQQLCVAAQMQGLGFRVITDSICESGYTLYRDNEPADQNVLHAATGWEAWVREFAIPTEKYYVLSPSGEAVTVLSGNTVALKSGRYTCYEASGEPAAKRKVDYIEGYMTPCVIVLVGNTADTPKRSGIKTTDVVTVWDGSYDPYPGSYGGTLDALGASGN